MTHIATHEKLLNEITNKAKLISRLADNSVKDGKMTSDSNEIAEHFNEYFINQQQGQI